MTERRDQAEGDALGELRAHTQRLAGELPGSLRRLSVSSGDATIEVEWQATPVGEHDGLSHLSSTNGHHVSTEPEPQQVDPVDTAVVTSPMVGTVYLAPSPDKPRYVELGQDIEKDQTVALIEAMKLFNPIVSDFAGAVLEVLVDDGQSVEFGQPLFRLGTAEQPSAVNGHE